MSYDGIMEFYKGRIEAAPSYGFRSGHQLLDFIFRCAEEDDMLTDADRDIIINLCELSHRKMLEEDFNNGWNQ